MGVRGCMHEAQGGLWERRRFGDPGHAIVGCRAPHFLWRIDRYHLLFHRGLNNIPENLMCLPLQTPPPACAILN